MIATESSDLFSFDGAVVSGDAGDDRIQGSGRVRRCDSRRLAGAGDCEPRRRTESGWGNDTLVHVTVVDASPYDDVLTGSGRMDGLYGEAGNDTIAVSAADFIGGGPGDDKLDGGTAETGSTTTMRPAAVHVSLPRGTAGGGGNGHAPLVRGGQRLKYGTRSWAAPAPTGSTARAGTTGSGGNGRGHPRRRQGQLTGADGGPKRDVAAPEWTIHCP